MNKIIYAKIDWFKTTPYGHIHVSEVSDDIDKLREHLSDGEQIVLACEENGEYFYSRHFDEIYKELVCDWDDIEKARHI